MVINLIAMFVVYIVFCLITALVMGLALMGLLYCICWIICFMDEFINNDWKDKND